MGGHHSRHHHHHRHHCQHNADPEEMRYKIHSGDTPETIAAKIAVNRALNNAESFEPPHDYALASAVQQFMDGHTLRHAEQNIAPGCGVCHPR